MKKVIFLLTLLLATTSLAGYADTSGSLSGSQIRPGGGRVLVIEPGTYLSRFISAHGGKYMDGTDRAKMYTALESDPNNQSVIWKNFATNVNYTMVPTEYGIYQGNPNCRRYYTMVGMGNMNKKIYSLACRQKEGAWVIVK